MFLAAALGLALSVLIEGLVKPSASLLRRRWECWALHAGLWLVVYGVLVFLLGRAWFSAASVTAFHLLLVLINNAKMRALREPFIFQDYEYFTDAIRHPRLYIPFLGWGKALTAASGFALAVAVGLWIEDVPPDRFRMSGQLGGVFAVMVLGSLVVIAGSRSRLRVSLDATRDVETFGLLASLWSYGLAERVRANLDSPFHYVSVPRNDLERPHLIAVQSESFFDPRPLFAGIRRDILAEFDRLKAMAVWHGRLTVPAWGANTVRTEFAFLSGITPAALGAHRFNPYRTEAYWSVPTLASFLKRAGYRTICVHPYSANFYRRKRVYPMLGFDDFIDVRAFTDAQRCGPYIGDAAVAAMISDILEKACKPVFIFAITMENHGPLHLEKASAEDVAELYTEPPPPGCDDLTVYLRHLRNADRMIAILRKKLEDTRRAAWLSWFGDHVPIMPHVYDIMGAPNGDTEFVLWCNASRDLPKEKRLEAHELAMGWLQAMKLATLSSGRHCSAGLGEAAPHPDTTLNHTTRFS